MSSAPCIPGPWVFDSHRVKKSGSKSFPERSESPRAVILRELEAPSKNIAPGLLLLQWPAPRTDLGSKLL